MKQLRCQGINKKGKICNTFLLEYEIKNDEINIRIKCPRCNSFVILKLPYQRSNQEEKNNENIKESLS